MAPRKRAPGAGRKPVGEIRGKTATLTTRIRRDTREALDTAAKANGRSLSQEVEVRLWDSFSPDDERTAHVRALAGMVIMSCEGIERITGTSLVKDWFTAQAVRKTIEVVLAHFMPEQTGDIPQQVQKLADAMSPEALGVIQARICLSSLNQFELVTRGGVAGSNV